MHAAPGVSMLRDRVSFSWLGLAASSANANQAYGMRPLVRALSWAEPRSLLEEAQEGFWQDFLSGDDAWVDGLLLLTALVLLVGLIFHIHARKAEAKRALERDLERRRFLENILLSLAHPFYVIDASTYEVLIANAAAREGASNPASTCYGLTHGLDEPCGGEDHVCPLRLVKETREQAVTEHRHCMAGGEVRTFEVHGFPVFDGAGEIAQMIEYSFDVTERKRAEAERENLIHQLETALREVKTLSGMLPICSSCKKVRDDQGYWNQIEQYISSRSDAEFSHSLCPECVKQLYPEYNEKPRRRA